MARQETEIRPATTSTIYILNFSAITASELDTPITPIIRIADIKIPILAFDFFTVLSPYFYETDFSTDSYHTPLRSALSLFLHRMALV